MKYLNFYILFLGCLFNTCNFYCQNDSQIIVSVDIQNHTLVVKQTITYHNTSNDTISELAFNDWMNAYSSKTTPLASRFSDEFYRGFHLAKDKERGCTKEIKITDSAQSTLKWERKTEHPDQIFIQLKNKIAPNEKTELQLNYQVKVPNIRFTNMGYKDDGSLLLKNCFLFPCVYENHQFKTYNNYNLEDETQIAFNINIEIDIPSNYKLTSDLKSQVVNKNNDFTKYSLTETNVSNFSIYIDKNPTFEVFKNDIIEVATNLKDENLNTTEKAIVIDKVTRYINAQIGQYPYTKITVSEADYEQNPFYGLNQLPSFISPFPNEFVYEIKFFKTYLNNFLKKSLFIDARKENWVYDAILMYTLMDYIEQEHPDIKLLGSLSKLKLFKNYSLTSINFNEQYSYLYMFMARKNLDQPLLEDKDKLIKFNEQISSKYKAGLSLKYLDAYLGNQIVKESIQKFYNENKTKTTECNVFEKLLKSNSTKNIDWFFDNVIKSRSLIEYRLKNVTKTKDSIQFQIKSRNEIKVPIPIYGLRKKEIVFKEWIDLKNFDSTYVLERKDADKIIINYKNEVPEYNLRNNWKSLKGFNLFNRPVKFTFFKDIEDPYYNQVFYLPEFEYNLYDGFSPGINFNNSSLLDKAFTYSVTPIYSPLNNSLIGGLSLNYMQNIRKDYRLYNINYYINSSTYHYAPNAGYFKIAPTISFRFRDPEFRSNQRERLLIRSVSINKEATNYVVNTEENYTVFNAKYGVSNSEITKLYSFGTDLQLANSFGKIAGEIQFRKLFVDNRQINLRLFAGKFLYRNTSSEYFSFGVDRPTDYMFDYGLLGRSESSGIFSQQYVMGEGGFKSKIDTRFANEWLTTLNGSFNIWNWIEIYGDVGFIKYQKSNAFFIYDNGIRLNLLPDYFELYFPVYSNNGWEIAQHKYNEKIRFVVTLSPQTLISLFTRKWF